MTWCLILPGMVEVSGRLAFGGHPSLWPPGGGECNRANDPLQAVLRGRLLIFQCYNRTQQIGKELVKCLILAL